MKKKEDFNKKDTYAEKEKFKKQRRIDEINFQNFFDMDEKEFEVLNPYSLEESMQRIDSLTFDDIKDDLKYFQVKDLVLRNDEETNLFSLNNIKFVTSSINNEGKKDFYLLNDLSNYLLTEEQLKIKQEKEKKDFPDKSIILEINTQENGKKSIIIKCLVEANLLSENIIDNFISKSPFEKAKEVKEELEKKLRNNFDDYKFKLTIKIQINSINKIYYNVKKGEYFFDLQNPPIFKTNFFVSNEEENKPSEENSLFPFRNFEDESLNLKYRHFIVMIQKKVNNININENDTNEELNNCLGNLFINKNGEADKNKYIREDIDLKIEDRNMKNLTYFFNYEKNDDIRKKLKKLKFLKKIHKNEEKEKEKEEEEEEKEEKKEKKEYNDEETIKLFYQVLALISECILSYYNGVELLNNLLIKDKYKNDIFKNCKDEDFPIFFNITLTKILDKYQNSLEENSLTKLEKEMKKSFNSLYAQYESVGLEEVLKPSKNPILMRVQRCVITPTYILFTPYVLEEGNRILRRFVKSINYSILCTFKMDSLEEARWNNKFLMEYIKFILSKGFNIGEKNFRFFNYSQSQFRNMSCWLITEPEKVISKIGDFSKIKQLSKYAARISQTLTTTIKTIKIPKDKIVNIPDKKSKDDKYTFSDGVGKISYILSKQISECLKLDYVPSCFQGRFLGCKGVWTTMWDDNTGQIYCRDSQIKFHVEKEELNYFELCDYSRYIQSYLNRQIILLLNSLGIKNDKFLQKLEDYKNRLNDQEFVLSLVYYPEWNQMLRIMNSCGINRTNDRLIKSIIESNIDILYNDVKKKARIYVEDSAYVIGIMDEYDVLEYGEAFLQIKRGENRIILDKKCAVAKCPCLHPGDIRVLNFRRYNKDDESTKKYEVFHKYENVIIFPSKGKRPHPDECSGSDLDGDNYFIFYDNDLIPMKTIEPMSYLVDKKEEKLNKPFSINDVIQYFAEYTNLNNLGLIGDAHLALSDKLGAQSPIAIQIAKKFSKAVDAPKTGDKVILSEEETPKMFPHYMGKDKNKTYQSKKILGQLYDRSNEFIYKRIKRKELSGVFYDEDLIIKGWENYAFLALIYYRDYFNDLVSLLKKNEINGESVLLTGNNIDNENTVLSKKKHNYDLREKIGNDMHNLFIKNKDNFYEAILNFFIKKDIKNNPEKNKRKKKNNIQNNNNWNFDKIDLINNDLFFMNKMHLFASACYMISYNISKKVIDKKNKENKNESIIEYYSGKFSEIINDNLIMDNNYEELNEISEYDSNNIGVDYYEYNENIYDYFYEKIDREKKAIKEIIDKKKNDMLNFIKDLKNLQIPKYANEENQYRILSFPWCISGHILSNIKFLNFKLKEKNL